MIKAQDALVGKGTIGVQYGKEKYSANCGPGEVKERMFDWFGKNVPFDAEQTGKILGHSISDEQIRFLANPDMDAPIISAIEAMYSMKMPSGEIDANLLDVMVSSFRQKHSFSWEEKR